MAVVVMAGRVGAAITAELGSMKVTEQIDALKSMGLSRTHFLVAPRFFALTFAMPLLVVLADVIGLLGAYVIAAANGVNSVAFWESAQSMLQPWDIYGGLIKAVFFATMVAAVACYKGLDTQGGASGVGQATTMSVVISLILIFVSNYFLSNFLF
jgi:phospholipid/cholesterol/gamma-HCH transport system permease protein